mmetsp:Transcript_20453/g.36387  ORF Transcript_20453/g.36387 Transcript_20453/m.36387 type:complete len:114 (+) Transcript_20453:1597-1938(+)
MQFVPFCFNSNRQVLNLKCWWAKPSKYDDAFLFRPDVPSKISQSNRDLTFNGHQFEMHRGTLSPCLIFYVLQVACTLTNRAPYQSFAEPLQVELFYLNTLRSHFLLSYNMYYL